MLHTREKPTGRVKFLCSKAPVLALWALCLFPSHALSYTITSRLAPTVYPATPFCDPFNVAGSEIRVVINGQVMITTATEAAFGGSFSVRVVEPHFSGDILLETATVTFPPAPLNAISNFRGYACLETERRPFGYRICGANVGNCGTDNPPWAIAWEEAAFGTNSPSSPQISCGSVICSVCDNAGHIDCSTADTSATVPMTSQASQLTLSALLALIAIAAILGLPTWGKLTRQTRS